MRCAARRAQVTLRARRSVEGGVGSATRDEFGPILSQLRRSGGAGWRPAPWEIRFSLVVGVDEAHVVRLTAPAGHSSAAPPVSVDDLALRDVQDVGRRGTCPGRNKPADPR